MWVVIVLIPDHCLSIYSEMDRFLFSVIDSNVWCRLLSVQDVTDSN